VDSWFNDAAIIPHEFGRVYCGMMWREGPEHPKSRLIHALKGRGCEPTWRRLGENFCRAHQKNLVGRWLFLPVPGRGRRAKDHAWRWTKSIVQPLGGHLYPGLYRLKGEPEQKGRSKEGRSHIKLLSRREDKSHWQNLQTRGLKLALGDDIVTSGSTALSAWRALYEPPAFAVMTLAFRISRTHLAKGRISGV
jgi:predicted amidophosphoribosyltransferase